MLLKLRRSVVPVAALVAVISALAFAAVASATDQPVTVQGFQFQTPSVTVNAGDTVTWTNKDSAAHTVTADNGAFDNPLPAGGSTTITFSQAGTFTYHCTIHPSMKGAVVVQAAAASGGAAATPRTAVAGAAAPATGSGVAPATSSAPLFFVLGGMLLAAALGSVSLAAFRRR